MKAERVPAISKENELIWVFSLISLLMESFVRKLTERVTYTCKKYYLFDVEMAEMTEINGLGVNIM